MNLTTISIAIEIIWVGNSKINSAQLKIAASLFQG